MLEGKPYCKVQRLPERQWEPNDASGERGNKGKTFVRRVLPKRACLKSQKIRVYELTNAIIYQLGYYTISVNFSEDMLCSNY